MKKFRARLGLHSGSPDPAAVPRWSVRESGPKVHAATPSRHGSPTVQGRPRPRPRKAPWDR